MSVRIRQDKGKGMDHGYTYQATLAASERASWRVEDLIGGDKRLDFSKPFLPEALARVEPLGFLNLAEKRTLNQIRGHDYLYLFGLVEEFIVPFVLDHARPRLHGDEYQVRALLSFANEEAKHIQLFRRFRAEFEKGFGSCPEVIGPPAEIARAVLAHHPLAVALTVLHMEWMTQCHYIDSVKDNQDLDTQFKSLLEHHWMEEAEHTKLDTLMIEGLVEFCTRKEIAGAVKEYMEIAMFLDGVLKLQTALDLVSFTRAAGRELSASEKDDFMNVQLQASRWTFIGSAMSHRKFLATLEWINPEARKRIEEIAPAYR